MEALALALERRRERYNTLFAEARGRHPALDADDFLDYLGRRVAPVVQAVASFGASAETEDRVLDALYRAALELVGRQLAGRRAPLAFIEAVWESLLPRCAALLAVAPQRVVASLSNAAFNLAAQPTARPAEWLQRVADAAARCPDVDTLAAVGQVAAWRAGMAHFREGALELCARLPESLVRTLLDVPASAPSDWLARLGAGAFVQLEASAPRVAAAGRVGGFRGFGGVFLTPPSLVQSDDRLFAYDHESAWEIHADAFGALLRRAEAPQAARKIGKPTLELARGGEVRGADARATFPGLAGAASAEAQGDLLAVALPDSHYVYLVAMFRGGAC